MTDVVIIGAGVTPFGKFPHLSLEDLGFAAAREAMKDAGVGAADIQTVYSGNALASQLQGEFTVGQKILWGLGINKIPVINVENACTSGSTAFYLACLAIQAGAVDVALVLGVEKMYVTVKKILDAGATDLETRLGFIVPASFAMRANRYMAEYGLTREEMAMVAVKNHRHGALNPIAQYRNPITVEEVLNSPMIADPLTRLSCCPQGDGAAAVVICRKEIAGRFSGKPVTVAASVLLSGSYDNPPELAGWPTDVRAAEQAYKMAGLGPGDLDVVELHDAFTIAEIIHCEGLGLCPPGAGGQLIKDGHTSLGGKIPVNPGGGLLSRGHPVGATGVAQLVEIVQQLRGRCGDRQVPQAGVGLAHCMGGDLQGDTRSVTINILTAIQG
jgi:acetyl-CoA acetyltransferase